jgi:phage shock protein A
MKTVSIFSRIRDIIENKMADQTENLEKMIEQNLHDLHRDLGKVKAEMATLLAEEQRLKRDINECQEGMEKMDRFSLMALDEGNERDAITFQEKNSAITTKLADLQAVNQLALTKSQQMKLIHDQLVADISELESIKRSGI